jgi:hypothetical protein
MTRWRTLIKEAVAGQNPKDMIKEKGQMDGGDISGRQSLMLGQCGKKQVIPQGAGKERENRFIM